MTPDAKTWKPTTQLGYGRTYTLTIAARGPGGMPSRQTSSFTTLTPSNQTEVYLDTTGGGLLQDGATYGVGMVVVAHFDEPIDQQGQRRTAPRRHHQPAGRRVVELDRRPDRALAAREVLRPRHIRHRRGQPLRHPARRRALRRRRTKHVSFKIGDSHVSIADDNTKQVSVFDNGKLVRTMPTSMGMGGTETIGGTTLSFWTPPGVYTVMDKANPVIMDSSTFGLPINSRLGYRETIPYATRISIDGIYLHQLNATVWAQGNTDTSHGCLNLNSDNAKWFYDFSVPGDVVEIRNTGGPPLQLSQNGDWTVPWDEWRKGSALS